MYPKVLWLHICSQGSHFQRWCELASGELGETVLRRFRTCLVHWFLSLLLSFLVLETWFQKLKLQVGSIGYLVCSASVSEENWDTLGLFPFKRLSVSNSWPERVSSLGISNACLLHALIESVSDTASAERVWKKWTWHLCWWWGEVERDMLCTRTAEPDCWAERLPDSPSLQAEGWLKQNKCFCSWDIVEM